MSEVRAKPPENPFFRAQDVIQLDEGQAMFSWPFHLSVASAAELEEEIILRMKSIKRRAGKREADKASGAASTETAAVLGG